MALLTQVEYDAFFAWNQDDKKQGEGDGKNTTEDRRSNSAGLVPTHRLEERKAAGEIKSETK